MALGKNSKLRLEIFFAKCQFGISFLCVKALMSSASDFSIANSDTRILKDR